MQVYQTNGSTLFKFEILEQFHEVRHFVTGRVGGFSEGNFKGLNLGFGTEYNPDIVLKNRHLLSENLGIPLDWMVFMRQTHSSNIAVVNDSHRGLGSYTRDDAIADTDALITSVQNVCINVQVADCVPLILLDSAKGIIAVVHAGWKGTLQEISRLTIEKMTSVFYSNPDDIVACIGPSIGPCCYEVGKEVQQQFLFKNKMNSDLFISTDNKLKLDLWKANKLQLLNNGVKNENIEISKLCTHCNHDIFFSSRFDKGNTGRFLAGIMLQ